MSFNQNIYVERVNKSIKNLNDDDLKWLCNQMAKLYRKYRNDCVDNFRLCRSGHNNSKTSEYDFAYSHGCCGFSDELIVNPKTGNSFWIGCNFGH